MNRVTGESRIHDGAPPRPSGQWGELAPRVASAVVLMAVALATAIGGGFFFGLFWLAASVGILWEWLRLVGGPSRIACFGLGTMLLSAAAALAGSGFALPAMALLGGGCLVMAALPATGMRLMSTGGFAYAGGLLISVSLLRHSAPFGKEAILFLFAVVWGTDCMAYFGGRLIGGPKLAPRLSPSKTWSGFLVGITSGSLLGWAVSPAPGCLGCMLLLGVVTGALAQAGDLFESMLKRRFDVKDTGHLIPGHGGLMDRLDGFVAASLFAAVLGLCRSGVDAAGAGLFQW